jgi:hypothetical protein
MWTSDDTVVTTTSITTVRVSTRIPQSASRFCEANQERMRMCCGRASAGVKKATLTKANHDRIAERTRSPEVMISAACDPSAGAWSCSS